MLETCIFCYFSCLTVKAKNNEINHDDDDDNDDEDDDFFNIYIFYIEDAWIGIKWGGGRGVGVGCELDCFKYHHATGSFPVFQKKSQ